jgi:hypothetical protein
LAIADCHFIRSGFMRPSLQVADIALVDALYKGLSQKQVAHSR